MNITANAASLDWRTNKHGVWKALVKDMAPNSSVTFSAGLTGTVAGKQVTVESQSMPTGFMTYATDITDAAVGSMLYGAGSVSDSLEAVGGAKTVRMGSVDLGTLEWTYTDYNGYRRFQFAGPSDARPNEDDAKAKDGLVCSSLFIPGRVTTQTVEATQVEVVGIIHGITYITTDRFKEYTAAEFKSAVSGVILYYELAEPVTSTETAQSLALQTGVNNLAMNERDSSFTLDYTGTDFTLQLDGTHKYAFSDNGVKSMLTGSTEQAVTGGQDMLVDVTRMFNGDATAINAVASWADMAAVMPEYLSNVAYNEGEVVGRSGGVTTAKWNQLVQNGNFFNTDGWTPSYCSRSVDANVLTLTATNTRQDMGITASLTIMESHRYYVIFDTRSSLASAVSRVIDTVGGNPRTLAISEPLEANTWTTVTNIYTAGRSSNTFCYQPAREITHEAGDTFQVRKVQLFDLTVIYGAGHEPSTVEAFEADCAKWGKDLAQYQPYDAGTPMGGSATFSDLHGVGTVKDTQDVVTGEKTVKIDSYTFTGNESFERSNLGDGRYKFKCFTTIPGIKSRNWAVIPNIVFPGYMPIAIYSAQYQSQTATGVGQEDSILAFLIAENISATDFKAMLAGRTLYYELATPTTSTETPQPLTAVQGLNNVHEQNMSITGTPLALGYTGTDQTIPAETSSKYLARIDGVDSVLENVESIDVLGGRDRVIDMTYMFGVGNEPATAADFYKLFPTWLGYAIPYNKGGLVNFKGTGLKSVGFNLLDLAGRTLGQPQNTATSGTTVRGPFDETKYYVGFNGSNSYEPTSIRKYEVGSSYIMVNTMTSFRGISFPIRVIPGREYRCENLPSIRRFMFVFYTYNGKFLNNVENISNTYVSATAPEDAYWCLLSFYNVTTNVDTVWTNPCVHFQWSGGRNGDYEPYWDYTRPLPTLTYFPSGMNGRGGVYDETTSRQAVTRLAEIDMEDLEWTESSGSWTATVSGMKAGTVAIVAENGLKPVVSGTSVTVQSETSPVGKLVYELANPSVVTFPEEANVTAQVSDYGTESVVPVNGYELVTAPFLGIVKYQDNYARTITKLPENYQSQESMDALQLVLGQLLNVTLTSRFDAEEQAYGYTVTGDGVPGLIAAALTALAPVTGLTFRGGTYMPTDGVVALPDPTIQAITTIPASTSSYTLGEGVYSHAPNSVPTYTLPAVEDATVVHTAKLTVKMSASVLTANFRDSAGDAISYEAPTGTISSGTLVEYVCTYEPLANGWSITARIVMQTA